MCKGASYFGVLLIVYLQCSTSVAIFLIVPEDVPTGLAGIYGFSPKIILGRDHRVGFGFRFGNHADFQILYELGPQLITRPLQTIQTRSARQRQRIVRRPFIELLFRAGLLKDISTYTEFDDEPIRAYEPR